MSTDTLTTPASELEEMLEARLPCGGVKRHGACPYETEATWVNTHTVVCDPHPAAYKCDDCFARWQYWAKVNLSGLCECRGCGRLATPEEIIAYYRRI